MVESVGSEIHIYAKKKYSSTKLLPTTISFLHCESDVSVSKIVLGFKNITWKIQFTTTHTHGLYYQNIHTGLYKLATMPRGWESTMPTHFNFNLQLTDVSNIHLI